MVDDASSDGTSDYFATTCQDLPHLRYFRNEINKGFAGSCNRGARESKGELLLFLNNDTEPLPNWLPPLVSILTEHREIGIVVPKLIFPDNTIQHCGKVWKDLGVPISQSHHIYYKMPADAPCVNRSREFTVVTGACFLVRRKEFFRVGCFDERYENGWEDDDLCYAYREMSKSAYYCAESTVIHHQSQTLTSEISNLQNSLPDQEALTEMNTELASPRVSPETVQAAEQAKNTMDVLEEKLLAVRHRFRKNRELFFSKWGNRVKRDDFRYYRMDGFKEDPDISRYAPELQSQFGIPYILKKVSVIIPLFNKLDLTRRCLETLRTNTPSHLYQLILVDNASTDGTAAFLSQHAMDASVITNTVNLGFAKACNQGARAATGDYLLFLNNDTEPQPGWLEPLIATLDADETVAATGSKLLFPDGTIQHAGVILADNRITPDPLVALHIYYQKPGDFPPANAPTTYQALTAACLMVRSSAFFSAGCFDEEYWNGYEDVDLCLKLQADGYKLIYQPASVVLHFESQSGKERFSKAAANIARLHGKWLGKAQPDVILNQDQTLTETANSRIRIYTPPQSEGKQTSTISAVAVTPLVSMVILTWNQLAYTRECIESIQRNTPEPHEIIFVDNGSTDGTVAWLRELVSQNNHYALIENKENLGFARGCNQGIEAASGEYILLLNNDTILTKEWLKGLLECLINHPGVGIVGPMTNNISGIQRVADAAYNSNEELEAYAARFREANRFRTIPLRRIVGFCMLFRRKLVDEIGLLDERFGSGNFEDDDFCLRAAIEGYTNLIAADVFIHHHGSASFSGNRINYSAAMAGNRKLFNEKWNTPVTDLAIARKRLAVQTLEKAENFFLRREIDKAVETLLQEGIRHDRDEKRYYYALAEYLFDAERYRDAQDALSSLPADLIEARRLSLTGLCEIMLNRPKEAELLAEHALSLAPCFAPALNLKGVIAQQSGHGEDAATLFRQAITHDPGYGEPYANLAMLEWEKGDRYSSLKLLGKAVQLAPSSARIANRYHCAITELGEFVQGEVLLKGLKTFFPNNRTVVFILIDMLLQQGKHAEALREIEYAITSFGVADGMVAAALEIRKQIGPLEIRPNEDVGKSVSLCMIMKNEEAHLPRCLGSLKPIVDEIIIVDTGSTDRSRNIATIFGAKVFDYPWTGDFGAARNYSLDQASGDWILVMDADEVISPLDHPGFREHIATAAGSPVAFEMVSRNYMLKVNREKWQPNDGRYAIEETAGGWVPSTKVRLFPNHRGVCFENAVHEIVEPSLERLGIPVRALGIPVHHYGYLEDGRQKAKKLSYYELGVKKLAESGGNDLKAIYELAVQAGEIGKNLEAAELWQRALAMNPQMEVGWFNLGYNYLMLGRFEESRQASRKALELKPGYRETITNLAMCELCIGTVHDALSILEPSLAANPDDPNTLLMMGVTLCCDGRSQEADKYLSALRSKQIVFAEFINECTRKLILAGKKELAKRLLSATIAGDNGNGDTETLAAGL